MASIPIYVPVRPTPALQSTKRLGYREGMASPSPTRRGEQSVREWKWKCVTTGYGATGNSSCCKLATQTMMRLYFKYLLMKVRPILPNTVLIARVAQHLSGCFPKVCVSSDFIDLNILQKTGLFMHLWLPHSQVIKSQNLGSFAGSLFWIAHFTFI